MQEANKYRTDLKTLEKNIEKSQNKYYKMWKKREGYEKEIEKAIQEHEKGNLSFNQVQKRSNQAFDVKKNAELAYHNYVEDLEAYNKMIEDAQVLYKDSLNKIQDLDEERVKTIQEWLSQFFTTFNDAGTIMKDKIEESTASIQLLNPQTDVKIFIDENRSQKPFFKKKDFVSYDYSKKILENKQERILSNGSQEDLIDFGRKKSEDSGAAPNPEIPSPVNEESKSKEFDDNLDLLGINNFEELKEDKEDTNYFNENKSFVTFLNCNVIGLLQKLENNDFINFLTSYDFLCLTETFVHLNLNQIYFMII